MIRRIVQLVFVKRILWIAIYWMDSAIHRINYYDPKDSAIGFCKTYPLDSDLFGG